jgi:hypothetical protein
VDASAKPYCFLWISPFMVHSDYNFAGLVLISGLNQKTVCDKWLNCSTNPRLFSTHSHATVAYKSPPAQRISRDLAHNPAFASWPQRAPTEDSKAPPRLPLLIPGNTAQNRASIKSAGLRFAFWPPRVFQSYALKQGCSTMWG